MDDEDPFLYRRPPSSEVSFGNEGFIYSAAYRNFCEQRNPMLQAKERIQNIPIVLLSNFNSIEKLL